MIDYLHTSEVAESEIILAEREITTDTSTEEIEN